ncbi:zinc ribbon domain-containing protein [Chloroflexota bacterium]
MLLGQSRCQNDSCRFTNSVLKEFRNSTGKIKCPKCGTETDSDDRFCKSCGTEIRQAAYQFSAGRFWSLFFLFLLLGAIIAIAIIFAFDINL